MAISVNTTNSILQTLQDLKANSRLELTVLQQILQQLIAMGQQAGVASPVDLSTAVM